MIPINDHEIDKIIWEEIHDSPSKGDFVCYLVHAPADAQHREKANAHIQKIGDVEDNAPAQYSRAIDRIRELAESGDGTAMFHMGKINALGIAGKQDISLAKHWYEKAMEAGEPRAYANLGWFYQSAYGVRKDQEKAFELLSVGADGGVISARAAVGLMLMSGEGCQADPERGTLMLEEAFNLGYINAGNHLADIYLVGKLLPQDIARGHDWLFKCVEQGDERTMAILGHYLVVGTHGKTDIKKGLSLLEDAIKKGYLLAYAWMAGLYNNGTGVVKDLGKAREWYEKGCAAGSKECEEGLARFFLENHPDQVSPDNKSLH